MDLDLDLAWLGVLTLLAGLSGLFLLGFVIFAIYSVIAWRLKKVKLHQIWGALMGVVLNAVIFLLTFPVAYPELKDIIERAILRFMPSN